MKKVVTLFSIFFLAFSINSKAGFFRDLFYGKTKAKYKVAVVLSQGKLGDKGFNDMAYEGLKKADKNFNDLQISYTEPNSTAELESSLRNYAKEGYHLIIANGFEFEHPCYNVAKDFPDTKFAIIDSFVDLPNVASLVFNEEEGSFLVGALSAMTTKTDQVGFVGGLYVPLIEKFYLGYQKGVKYIDPSINVLEEYIGGDNPFNDQKKGYELASTMSDQGADIIYHAAGGSGLGVINAAKDNNIYAIGVDKNQDAVAPGFVLTSMVKKVDFVVFDIIKNFINNNFKSGEKVYGISNGGIGLTNFQYSKKIVTPDIISRVNELKSQIINKEIIVLR